jgi:ATP-binding cassette, subfamily B, bacterial
MADLCRYSSRPLDFMYRFIRRRWIAHAAILTCVLVAVVCSVSAQYGVKLLVDALSEGIGGMRNVWIAFLMLLFLIAADNLLWRIASLIANFSFVGVTGDLRRDLFSHLTGHAPSYFADRLPGTLASRVTATSNAVFTAENMFVWNILPPCAATVAAIAFVGAISVPIAATLTVVAGIMMVAMFHMAAAGRPLHHDFADKTASVDGQMVDVLSNMPIVRAFCGWGREQHRFDSIVDQEMTARRSSLRHQKGCVSCGQRPRSPLLRSIGVLRLCTWSRRSWWMRRHCCSQSGSSVRPSCPMRFNLHSGLTQARIPTRDEGEIRTGCASRIPKSSSRSRSPAWSTWRW